MAELTTMVKELFIIAILAPIALQLILAGNYTGVSPVVVNIFTFVIPIIFGAAAVLRWMGKI